MTTLEKIRAEIKKRYDDCEEDWENGEQYGYWNCLKILDKYAEQEPTDDKCHYCEHDFTPYQGNTGEFTEQESSEDMPCITPEEMQKCKDIVKKYTPKQEPCDDIVSRQEALNAVTFSEVRWQAIERIKQLPSVRPQEPKWIPVSERLPESAGVYIVTREFTDGFECADLADACYFDGTSTWHDDNRINHGREYVDKKIKAWMPLPEPYEPQESEE